MAVETSFEDQKELNYDEMGEWAQTIYLNKYSWKDENQNPTENWLDTTYRVVRHVLGALGYTDQDIEFQKLVQYIAQRKFIPGGRYLAQAGRPFHQVNNCFLVRCGDSISDPAGWADTVANAIKALSSGGGVGVVYSDVRAYGTPISRTGGIGTGPLSPAKMVNEVAREVIAGGNRRAALWGGLHWNHPDIFDWINVKDWSEEIRVAKEKNFNFAAPLDMTNISVILDSEFFFAYQNEQHPQHQLAYDVYWMAVKQMLKHGEPGFSIDVGENAQVNLRNPCVTGDTWVMTDQGPQQVQELIGKPHGSYVDGQLFDTTLNGFWQTGTQDVYNLITEEGYSLRLTDNHQLLKETHFGYRNGKRQDDWVEVKDLKPGDTIKLTNQRGITWTGTGGTYAEGWTLGSNKGDGTWSRNAATVDFWGESQFEMAGIAIDYIEEFANENDSLAMSQAKDSGRLRIESKALTNLAYSYGIGPKPNKNITDAIEKASSEFYRGYLRGLFDADGSVQGTQQKGISVRLGQSDIDTLIRVQRMLARLGIISTIYQERQPEGYRSLPNGHGEYKDYWCATSHELVIANDNLFVFRDMIGFHEPDKITRLNELLSGYKRNPNQEYFTAQIKSIEFDGVEDVYDCTVPEAHAFDANGIKAHNCTEVVSEDNNDVCCLGSINLSRIGSIEELREITDLATLFLIAGTVYSDVPYEGVKLTREKNRRIGLGLMGLHEWLIQRGYSYEMVDELRDWLANYAHQSDESAIYYANAHNLSIPIAKRAIAPTGTIGILAETTTGIEPVFVVAYKRRFLDRDSVWKYQYVIDPTVERMKDQYGMDPDKIETAMTLAGDPEKRIKFQAEVQEYVDMAISSTVNLPQPIEDPDWVEYYGEIFMKYLPRLRGLTCYPSGARAGQPLTPVKYSEAINQTGLTFIDDRDEQCLSGSCGV